MLDLTPLDKFEFISSLIDEEVFNLINDIVDDKDKLFISKSPSAPSMYSDMFLMDDCIYTGFDNEGNIVEFVDDISIGETLDINVGWPSATVYVFVEVYRNALPVSYVLWSLVTAKAATKYYDKMMHELHDIIGMIHSSKTSDEAIKMLNFYCGGDWECAVNANVLNMFMSKQRQDNTGKFVIQVSPFIAYLSSDPKFKYFKILDELNNQGML